MNERQRRFAEHYAADPNATEAAKAAGYSPQTARSAGQRLLTNVDILQHIKTLQNERAEARIITPAQAKAFWSDIVNNPNEKTSDRLKASELLAKAAGAFSITAIKEKVTVSCGTDDDDVIIYLPAIQDETECQADETEDLQ